MKSIITTLLFFFAVLSANAQSGQYEGFKDFISGKGWTFENDKTMSLREGKSDYGIFKLKAGRTYKMFCMSDDPDVKDTDVWVYDSRGEKLLAKDESNEKMGIVTIDVDEDMAVKVLGKNVSSDSNGSSRFYILIAYK